MLPQIQDTDLEGVLKRSIADTYYVEQNGRIIAKECTECGEVKELDSFYYQKLGIAQKRSKCKPCLLKQKEVYREANREKIAEYHERNKISRYTNRHCMRAKVLGLPGDLTKEQHIEVGNYFNESCALTEKPNELELDHVLPLSIGHGGTTVRNVIFLNAELNSSKKDRNIFEWFQTSKKRFNLSQRKFDDLIVYLSTINKMSVDEYRDFVYWCHENPRI